MLGTVKRLGVRRHMLAGAGCGALLMALVPLTAIAQSQVVSLNIRSAPLSQSLLEFGRQAGISIAADQSLTSGLRGSAVSGDMAVDEGLDRLLQGTGLRAEFAGRGTVRLVRAGQGDAGGNDLSQSDPQTEAGQTTTVDDIIVTAQKREESIQDVPIAVSAFSAETLDALKIEGGSELLRAIPNVAFSKSNFSMYNFAIRGIGTKAISSSSDPAVAVSFNNSPMIRNRLFEAEYLDVSRVEVLRGPQGTLYGRNATAGVVNMIPNLPRPDFDAMMKGEVGNYGTVRGQMMLNIPLSDNFWVRGAASMTKRDGFDFNTHTGERVNGRDLHSVRLAAAWEPTDRFRSNLIWERFGEADDRLRTGKNLCTRDPGPTQVGTLAITNIGVTGKLSQGCLPGSLYDDAAYGTPNASGFAPLQIAATTILIGSTKYTLPRNEYVYIINGGVDPYAGVTQSKNLREISTSYNPKFEASNDILQLNAEFDLTQSLTLYSQTLYTKDDYYSTQDYSRYVSNPIFNDSENLYSAMLRPPAGIMLGTQISPGGFYVDPQLGPSRGMLSADISMSNNKQFYQELRLQSDFDGKFNFVFGANYLKFEVEDDYYVLNNTFSLLAEYLYGGTYDAQGIFRTRKCQDSTENFECVYVDYSSLSDISGDGRNYFRSKNVVETESMALFGELYSQLTESVKVTLGARYTSDEKTTSPYPSQLLLGYSDRIGGPVTGGSSAKGMIADPDVVQKWEAFTGRAVVDWKVSEDVMAYASLARGYKGGGTNPPRPGINPAVVQYQPLAQTFDPEYVTAFELGFKSNLFDNRLRLNLTGFYYDYEDYQVSQIVDRISLNENFDTKSMGLELEAVYRVTPDFRIDMNLGYLKTKIGDGEGSVDVMNRTQGNEDWMLVRPWAQVPSNCIAPKEYVEKVLRSPLYNQSGTNWLSALSVLCGGAARLGTYDPDFPAISPLYSRTGVYYNPLKDAPNGGRGFDADLSGNELPNAPNFTFNIGAQYTWRLRDWDLNVRADYYRQSSSFFRVYNTEYDKIRGWGNSNLTASLVNDVTGTEIQFYVKNLLDDAPIVDAFTNSDDSLLTTNVFTLDPRLIGFSVRKSF